MSTPDLLPELEDCTCQQFVDGEGDDRNWSTTARYVLCTCGHSAAWHRDGARPLSGACTFPSPALKRIREGMSDGISATDDAEPAQPAYWELVANGETPTGKPTALDLAAWNEQRRILFLAADIAGVYGDPLLGDACSGLAFKIMQIAQAATAPGTEE